MASAEEQARADWPEFGLVDDIRPALATALREGEASALATLYAAEGGAPRGIGAQMLITRRSVAGYVGGGCVEADVALHALQTIDDGAPRRLIYGLGGPIDIKLPCGGWIGLLV
jgi:xanthine dehydrogenase accessory factor